MGKRHNTHISTTEMMIVGLLLSRQAEACSISDISKMLKLDYSHIHDMVKGLEKRKIVRIRDVGRSRIARIAPDTADSLLLGIGMAFFANTWLGEHFDLRNLMGKIEKELAGSFYIALLFGSHAKGLQKKGSDYDMLFITADKNKATGLADTIRRIAAADIAGKRLDFASIGISEFIAMLGEKDTVGREAFGSCIVLHGMDIFADLVKRYDYTLGH